MLCDLVNSASRFRISGRFSESSRFRLLSTARFAVSGTGRARGCRGSRDGYQTIGEAAQVLSVHAQPEQLHRRSVTTLSALHGYLSLRLRSSSFLLFFRIGRDQQSEWFQSLPGPFCFPFTGYSAHLGDFPHPEGERHLH